MMVFLRSIAGLLIACLLNIAPGLKPVLQLFTPLLPIVASLQTGAEKVPAVDEYIPMETLPVEEETGTEELDPGALTEERAWELLDRTNSALYYLRYYFADRGLLDEENVSYYTPAVDPDREYACASVVGVENQFDLVELLQDDYTYRFVQERFIRGLFYDEENMVYVMEGQWFEDWENGGLYLLDNWASGDVTLLEDTLQIAKTGVDTYKISAEMEYDLGRFYCDVICQDGVYKVAQCHEGTGQPDYRTAKTLLARFDKGNPWLLYHFSTDDLVNWDDTVTINVMEEMGGEQLVDAYAVQGIETEEDLRQALSQYYTEKMVAYYLEASYETGNRQYYHGDWFEENGKLHFMPNWGMGDPMTFYDTTQVKELGENRWEISASAEYELSSSCVVVYDEESGRYLIDQ